MTYKIKTFISTTGERFSQLYKAGGDGFPLFYPTAYIARTVRLNTSHETQKIILSVIKRVYEWEQVHNIDIEFRLHCQKLLTLAEIDSLADYLRICKQGKSKSVIGIPKFNTNIMYAAQYIQWLAYQLIKDSSKQEIKELIKQQINFITSKKIRKAGSKSYREQKILHSKLDAIERYKLQELFDSPFDTLQRSQNTGQRFRNVLMLRILYETGMRTGELLSLKLKNFQESSGGDSAYIVVERNHNDPTDLRHHQPVAKTSGRILPVSRELENQLYTYITTWRADVPNVGFSRENFIFITHRGGQSQGKALTKKSFESAINNIKKKHPVLMTLHPHLLRHDWNYRFSQIADEQALSEEQEKALRENLMGWAPGSSMSTIYNRRHIYEKARKIGLMVASMTKRRGE
ncbi:site-specific integrase [Enterobacter ludwigii]|uniref:site-specific integrase n=1 Tax=Enterobacter ludwigii TaxID=299767 RepID=UPI002FCFFE63